LGAVIRTRRGALGLALAGSVVLVAAIGPFVAPYSPDQSVTFPFAGPSSQYLLGSDMLGRDVLSRVLAGGWELLLMALAATVFGVFIGAAAGISAAYLRGRVDGFIMRTVDVFLAFPQLVFALLLVSIVGPKIWLIVVAVGFTHAPAVARVLRSSALEISERDYVKSIELQGVRPAKIMRSEILPNLVSPLMVESGLRFTYSIVMMAGLAFLGFGLPPPAPSWGYMIQENRIGLSLNVWAVAVPVILIAVLTIGVNTFTDAIARVAIGLDSRPDEALIDDTVVEA
jgi:peptide/nickel transport system permease protein